MLHTQQIRSGEGLTLRRNTLELDVVRGPDKKAKGSNVEAASKIGKLIAERAKKAKVEDVVFDRGGYRYHGRVAALGDAAREAGLNF